MKLPVNVSEREKKFLLIGGAAVLLIVLYHLFTVYSGFREGVLELSDAKRNVLEKQLQRLSEKDDLIALESRIRNEIVKQEKVFLRGNKPPVAAAVLQRFLKEKATALNLEVKQERTLSPVDGGAYLGIPVEIGFRTSAEKLKELLYSLRTAPFLLTVSELKIRVTNVSNPTDVFATLVVSGFIKNPEGDEESKDKNAA